MAAGIADVVLKDLLRDVSEALNFIGIHSEVNVKLLKKSRDLKDGDIIIPEGCIKLDELKKIELLEQVSRTYETPRNFIMKVTRDRFSILAFHLDRAKFCKTVFKEIQDGGDKYGHARDRIDGAVFINCASTADTNSSLTDLRLAMLNCHLEKLLVANGYSVNSQARHKDNHHVLINDAETASTEQTINLQQSNLEQHFINAARQLSSTSASSDHLENQICNSEKLDANSIVDTSAAVNGSGSGETIDLDLKRIVRDNQFCIGSGGFDTNLSKVTVVRDGQPTDIMNEAINLAEVLQMKQCRCCLHLVPQQQVFKHQQLLLILTALSEEKIKQSLLVVGPVTVKQVEVICSRTCAGTTQTLYESRYQQMKEASEMRNLHTSTDESSDRQIQLLVSASITLDLLSNSSHTSLQIDTSSTDRGAESRLGAFVLYNAARLATLMSHFKQAVQKGLYPPLPSVDDIDFSVLREQEDWELVYLYLAAFPSVVRQSLELLFPTDGKNLAKIHTNKVTNFIVGFTKCLSAHYSRYHVLTGGEAHLLPLMYARIHLLKSAHQVLINSLQLVAVEALSYL